MASLKPKVLGIAGSPRRNSNTELLLQQAVAGASSQGAETRDLFHHAMATVKSWFIILGVTYAGDLLFPGVDKKGAIVQHPAALREAFHAGQTLVQV